MVQLTVLCVNIGLEVVVHIHLNVPIVQPKTLSTVLDIVASNFFSIEVKENPITLK